MTTTRSLELTGRARAMLRAVAAGRAEFTGGSEPDLYVDGLPCCDQTATHELVHAGLLRLGAPAAFGQRVCAELTDAGKAALRH
jgi:hypothetical protein